MYHKLNSIDTPYEPVFREQKESVNLLKKENKRLKEQVKISYADIYQQI